MTVQLFVLALAKNLLSLSLIFGYHKICVKGLA